MSKPRPNVLDRAAQYKGNMMGDNAFKYCDMI